MENTIKISVIVPIYKVEQYIKKCIESIINQNYHNLEIILVDDGSPDNCGDICEQYAKTDNRIIVIHKNNGGLSSARNAGIDICSGDYIMFVDSDDWIEKNFCEKALSDILEKKVDCLSFGYYKHFKDKVVTNITKCPRYLSAEEAIKSIVNLDDTIYNFAWNKIYKRNIFERIRYPEGKLFEDQGTTYKIFDLIGKIYVTNIPLYHYIQREDSIMGQKLKPNAINDRFDLWKERLTFLKSNYPSIYNDQLKSLTNHIADSLPIIGWNGDKQLRLKLEQFLKENRQNITKLKNKRKILLLFYYFYPVYFLYMIKNNYQEK